MKVFLLILIFSFYNCKEQKVELDESHLRSMLDSLIILYNHIETSPDSIITCDEKAYIYNGIFNIIYSFNFNTLKQLYVRVDNSDILSVKGKLQLNNRVYFAIDKLGIEGAKKLMELSKSPNEDDRIFSAHMLSNFRYTFVENVLEKLINDSSTTVRVKVIESLANINYDKLKPYLNSLYDDNERIIRINTIVLQLKYDRKQAIPVLISFLNDPDLKLREDAFLILKTETKKDFSYDPNASRATRAQSIRLFNQWWESGIHK